MNFIFFIDSLGSGGAQRQMVELAKGFKELGHEVSFLTYHNINFFKSELDKHNIPLKTIIEPNYVIRLFKIRKAIRIHQPDGVLSFLQAANFMATFAGFPNRNWKLVVGERSANPAILNNFKLKFYRKAHFFTDYVVGNSNANIELVKKIIPRFSEKKIKVIYNLVEASAKLNSFRSKKEKVSIVIAASYRPVKNLDGLIEAIKSLPNELRIKLQINWYGHIVEDNYYYQSQQKKIKDYNLDKIIFLNDNTEQIYQKYDQADFVALFSHYEGFPNAICEAMAMAKPVIVSKVSDIPLFIKENENGFLCDSKHTDSIKKALLKAIYSNQNQIFNMGLKNLEVAEQNFNKQFIVNQYLELLK
jgi:glycosyltransferase involved in cell wall biosynthesis